MVSIDVDNLSLRYRVFGRLTLGGRDHDGPIRDIDNRRYVQALDGVSFTLSAGDRLGLVGSNGAGKTTLLKVLYGIFEPTGGRVAVDGRVDALFNIHLGFRREATGRRNIVLRGLINGWSQEEIDRRMDAIIEFSELGDFIDMPFKSYSQGMAARLAFSVATTFQPEIMLMDEWIGAGDPAFQEKAGLRMAELTQQAGIIVLASHDKNLIRLVCNKVLVLEKGKVKDFLPIEDYE